MNEDEDGRADEEEESVDMVRREGKLIDGIQEGGMEGIFFR